MHFKFRRPGLARSGEQLPDIRFGRGVFIRHARLYVSEEGQSLRTRALRNRLAFPDFRLLQENGRIADRLESLFAERTAGEMLVLRPGLVRLVQEAGEH